MIELDINPRKGTFWRLRKDARPQPTPWCWPLPRLGGRDPVAIPVGEDDRCGVDVGYASDGFGPSVFVPVYAVQRGYLSFAYETSTGFTICIDHGSKTSHYAQLGKMFVNPALKRTRRPQFVARGQIIGAVATAPVRIRFELWEHALLRNPVPLDAASAMKEWVILSEPSNFPTSGYGQEAA